MSKHTLYIFSCFLLLVWIPSDALCRWVSHLKAQTGQETVCNVQANSDGRLVVNVTFPGFSLQQDSLSPEFSATTISGCDLLVEPGQPQLPVWNRLLAVPEGRQFVIERVDITDHYYSMRQLEIELPVKPAPEFTRVDEPVPQARTELDAVYNQDSFYPREAVRLDSGGVLRGNRIARLQISPLQYNAVRGEFRMISRIECTLKVLEAGAQYRNGNQTNPGPLFRQLLDNTALEITPQTEAVIKAPQQPGYLIITPDIFLKQAGRLAEWKTQKGFSVHVAPLSETGSTVTEIQNYIRQAYWYHEKPPEFVLLAGDITHIPAFNGRFSLNPHVPHITDLYYATMDGDDDIFPDVMIGRLPAADTTQLRIMIDKIIAYEKLSDPNRSWLDNATFIATRDANFHNLVERGHRNSINKYFEPRSIQSDSIWTFYDNNRQQLNNAVDRGTSLVLYSGHGSETYWNDLDDYSLVELYYLQNSGRYPLVLSFGCNAGAFDFKIDGGMECLGESFLNYENRGAVLFWGSTFVSFWHQDYYLQEQFMHAAFDKGYESFGQTSLDALLQLYARGYSYTDFYMETYNILGDPSLPLWLGSPRIMAVQHPPSLAAGVEHLYITVTDGYGPVDGALAALSQNGRLLGAAITQNGIANIGISEQLDGVDVLLTVSKAQLVVYQAQLEVAEAPQVLFTPDTLLANTEQFLHINVSSSSGTPQTNYRLAIAGMGLDSVINAVTDTAGQADIPVNCPYGQLLYVYGSALNDTVPNFVGRLPVKSEIEISGIDIHVSTPAIQADSILTPGIPGQVELTAQPEPEEIFVQGCGIDTVFTLSPFTLIPHYKGNITISLGTAGYQLYQSEIPVTDVTADLAGMVLQQTDSLVLAQATVRLQHNLSGTVYQVNSDDNGEFIFTEITAGYYYLQVYKKGYKEYCDSLWVIAGQNNVPIYLQTGNMATISGLVTLAGKTDFSGVVVRVKDQGVADTTNITGQYTLTGVIPDTINVIVQYNGYTGQTRQLVAGNGANMGGIDFILSPGISLVNETFEKDSGDFTGSGLWQWGVPKPGLFYRGPDKAHSGNKVWGTVLDGDYAPLANCMLTSPDISLVGYEKPVLQFYHFYCMDYLNTGYDGGNVQLSDDGGRTWMVIQPQGDYPCDSLAAENIALVGEPGFSGCIDSWQLVSFDLRAWTDRHIKLRFHFGSTALAEDAGWFIDDFAVFDSSTVNINSELTTQPTNYVLWQNYPNPFNAETIISYDVPENSYIQVTLFNTLGQKVKNLVSEQQKPGRYTVRWQGRDESGYQVSAGIYLVQLKTAKFSDTKKIALLR